MPLGGGALCLAIALLPAPVSADLVSLEEFAAPMQVPDGLWAYQYQLVFDEEGAVAASDVLHLFGLAGATGAGVAFEAALYFTLASLSVSHVSWVALQDVSGVDTLMAFTVFAQGAPGPTSWSFEHDGEVSCSGTVIGPAGVAEPGALGIFAVALLLLALAVRPQPCSSGGRRSRKAA